MSDTNPHYPVLGGQLDQHQASQEPEHDIHFAPLLKKRSVPPWVSLNHKVTKILAWISSPIATITWSKLRIPNDAQRHFILCIAHHRVGSQYSYTHSFDPILIASMAKYFLSGFYQCSTIDCRRTFQDQYRVILLHIKRSFTLQILPLVYQKPPQLTMRRYPL